MDIDSFVESVSVLFLTLQGKEGNFLPSIMQDVMIALNFKNKFHGRSFLYIKFQ